MAINMTEDEIELKLRDFFEENFEFLNDEISRERLSIGGPGIASGLEITPIVNDTQFAIKVSAASIVDKNGNEIFIEDQIIDIERIEQLINLFGNFDENIKRIGRTIKEGGFIHTVYK